MTVDVEQHTNGYNDSEQSERTDRQKARKVKITLTTDDSYLQQ